MTMILKIDSWKIFFGIIIFPIISIAVGVLLSKLTQNPNWSVFAPVIAALSMCFTYFGWLWTAGVSIYKTPEQESQPNPNIFKALFIYSTVFSFIISPFLKVYLADQYKLPLTLLSFISLLSFLTCIYLIVKNLKNAEKNNHENRNSLILDFILVWFLPIGIWFIQPRVRKIITAGETA